VTAGLDLGTTIADCRIEAVRSQGAWWTEYRARHLKLDRTVALTVLAPGPDPDRERFTRAVELAATVDHPSLLAAREWGEADGRFYLLTRWIDGEDLHSLVASRGPQTQLDTLVTLRPVASALAAAHRRGLVHGDVASAHVLISHGDDGGLADVYLSGFGIAQLNRSTATRSADISAFGRLLLEVLTGSAPDQREIETARNQSDLVVRRLGKDASTTGIGDRLAAVIAQTLATDPADGFASADELVLALERARAAARATPLAPGQRRDGADRPLVAAGRPSQAMPVAIEVRRRPAKRRPLQILAVAAAVVPALALIVALATYGGPPRRARDGGQAKSSTGPARVAPRRPLATIDRGHLSVGREIRLGAAAGDLAVARSETVWVSLPARGELVEIAPNRPRVAFSGINDPGPLAAGSAGVWVGNRADNTVALFAGHRLGNPVAVPGRPVTIGLDQSDGSAWVADVAGGLSHVALRGGSTPVGARLATTHLSPPATGVAVGEPNWVWAVDGRLVRADPVRLQSRTFAIGPGAVGVTVNQGIWTAHTNGAVTRFDPRPGHEDVAAVVRTPAPLSQIAAREGSPLVWALSGRARSLYEVAVGDPRIVGVVRFTSRPTYVAVTHLGVWVTTAAGWLIRIKR
jgi:Protein kinase domain